MVRDMQPADAGWAAELMNQRRQAYASYSPVFWRPARDATGPHAAYLSTLIGSGNCLSLRTDHGFMLGQIRPAKTSVDDFAVSEPGRWTTDGSALVLAAAQRLADAGRDCTMLVVTAHADDAKVGMLRNLSLSLVEQWWVHEVEPTGEPIKHGQVQRPGFAGFFGSAPPVYDPGGPVLHVDRAQDDVDLATMELEAASIGAVLLVLPATPGADRVGELQRRGWTVASDWYQGHPSEAA
ncbi:MAG: hypothetical protein ACRDNF_12430 [Streptosporangiaceae bacterium]